ncbi:MAG: hypothetical protein J9259_09345 [Thermoplasmata archaeon YP2-bin.285]|uniref:Uncharacterized protein n=1 Tax=Candidatus Sysuiplasma superficiale TaxID=2823368 RepID=A0A8J8CBT3_9ARCH|nr:hypothetical protein [Candidatus Sysuiplasma superficiale]
MVGGYRAIYQMRNNEPVVLDINIVQRKEVYNKIQFYELGMGFGKCYEGILC